MGVGFPFYVFVHSHLLDQFYIYWIFFNTENEGMGKLLLNAFLEHSVFFEKFMSGSLV